MRCWRQSQLTNRWYAESRMNHLVHGVLLGGQTGGHHLFLITGGRRQGWSEPSWKARGGVVLQGPPPSTKPFLRSRRPSPNQLTLPNTLCHINWNPSPHRHYRSSKQLRATPASRYTMLFIQFFAIYLFTYLTLLFLCPLQNKQVINQSEPSLMIPLQHTTLRIS